MVEGEEREKSGAQFCDEFRRRIYLLGRKNNLPININSAIFHGDYSDTIYRMGREMCPIHLLNSWWVAFDDGTRRKFHQPL